MSRSVPVYRVSRLALTSHPLPLTRTYLDAQGLRGLHCGCGPILLTGFLNCDLGRLLDSEENSSQLWRIALCNADKFYFQCDLAEPLPFADSCFDFAYSEHCVEHLAQPAAIAWLAEVRRVLKPGGVLRISTPDLRLYASAYLQGDSSTLFDEHRRRLEELCQTEIPARRAWMVNQIFYGWGHQWIYDLDELTHIAVAAGFSESGIHECRYRQSRVPELSQVDSEHRNDESLYVEIENG